MHIACRIAISLDSRINQLSVTAVGKFHSRLIGKLPESLKAAAELRLKFPDATLRELSEASIPPVGKSGFNHRLMRLSSLAEKLRYEEG